MSMVTAAAIVAITIPFVHFAGVLFGPSIEHAVLATRAGCMRL
jgi:hypothetical protein